jgi:hypothetical protein
MAIAPRKEGTLWRLVVVGGHTRSIGKTQLVCDIIAAFPKTEWIAGKITQYGHGVWIGRRGRIPERIAHDFWRPGRSGRSG